MMQRRFYRACELAKAEILIAVPGNMSENICIFIT